MTCRKTNNVMKLDPTNQSKFSGYLTHLVSGGVITILTVISVLTFSKTAHASLVSFVSSLLGSESVSAEVDRARVPTGNSQTAEILQHYAINIDPNPDKSSDIIPIDNENTLNSDLASSNGTSTDTSNTQISTYKVRSVFTIST